MAGESAGSAEAPFSVLDSEFVRVPRQARSEETLNRFLDATAALLADRPFADISVNDIVEAADRTVGSFYARFEDKAGVLRVLVEERAYALRQEALDYWAVERWAHRSIGDIVSLAVDAVLNAYRNAAPVFHAAAIEATTDPAFRDLRRMVWDACAESFGRVVAAHAREVSSPDPARAGQVAMTALIATTDMRLIYGDDVRPTHTDPEEHHADLAAMVLAIIDPLPRAPRPIVPPRPV